MIEKKRKAEKERYWKEMLDDDLVLQRDFMETFEQLYNHTRLVTEEELNFLKDYYQEFPGEFNKPGNDLMLKAIKFSRRTERGSKKEKEDLERDKNIERIIKECADDIRYNVSPARLREYMNSTTNQSRRKNMRS